VARQWAVCIALVSLQIAAFGQSRGGSTTQRPTTAELSIRVVLPDSTAYEVPVRVQLLNSSRTPIAETYTRNDGMAQFSGVNPGEYLVKVSSMDIEESTASFSIYPRESQHQEYVTIKLKNAAANSSTQGSISAATLNIPKKASKDLEKGIQALDENRTADAATYISKAIETYPRFPAAWNAQGVVAMKTDDREKARVDFEKAIEYDGNFVEAYVNLAKLQIREKKNTEALASLNKAISINPRNPSALLVLANLELTSGKYDDAIKHANQVHALPHPNYSAAHLVAAMAFERKDAFADAVAEYKMFLDESPGSPSQDKVRAALESAQKHIH
jgi:tetratricopeptide (TPR) repeat protein